MSNTIEYNETITGKRNESIIYSLRPLTAKLASSIQTGFVYIFLVFSGLLTLTNQISNLEASKDAGEVTEIEVIMIANELIDAYQTNSPWGSTIFKFGMVMIPLILFAISYYVLKSKPTIDEKTYNQLIHHRE
jgi:Na+/melibiose symporter-like transporter